MSTTKNTKPAPDSGETTPSSGTKTGKFNSFEPPPTGGGGSTGGNNK